MKTKILEKKGNKPSLNKTLVTKTKQQKNAVKSKKKIAKKAKLAISVQNGNPTLKNKTQVFKIADKPKQKQNKKAKQQNVIAVKKVKTKGAKEETSSTIVEPKKDVLSETDIKSLEYLERRQKRRNLRKIKRQQQHQHSHNSTESIKFNIEEIKKRIERIKSRKVLSKSAKRILAVLNKKLRLEETGANKSDKSDTTVKKDNEKSKHLQTLKHKKQALAKSKQANNEDKIKAKKKQIQNKRNQIKSKKLNVMKNSIGKDESEENRSDAEEKLTNPAKKQINDDKNKVDKEDTDNEINISEVTKSKKKHLASLDHQKRKEMKKKKKRYILSVDNLSSNVTADEIKQHFLTKLGVTTNVKMHSDGTRRFACVMVTNFTDFKKGLLLNDTLFMKKKISVQCLMPKDNKKADIKTSPIAKNKKQQVLQKAGKLSKNQKNQGKKIHSRRRNKNVED